jgi:hypothetical protein
MRYIGNAMDLAKLRDFAKLRVDCLISSLIKISNPTLISKDIWQGFPHYEIKLFSEYDRWQEVAKISKLSREASLRLEWIIYY